MKNASDLNTAQQHVVDYSAGHVLIVAGPGTGKTHTLVHRIAHFIPKLQSHQRILAFTFTNKAAVQLHDRLMALDVPQRQVFAGTFQGFCLNLLRAYWDKTALPKDFRIASEEELKYFDKSLRERIGLIKSTQLVINPDEEFKLYTRALRQQGMIDVDDILREALELLEDATIAATVQKEYPYIFIDEYEDINVIQHALLKRLAGATGVVTAFGDPNQSIGRCHGSKDTLLNRFEEDFEGATLLSLSENFRFSPDRKVNIHEALSDRAEADYVACQIEKMMGTHHSLGGIAIFYRLDMLRQVMMQALDHLGIPYLDEDGSDYASEKVTLLSLHDAKGLEFPVVFMIGCEDNLLPLDLEGMKGDLEEERRLFFVGMTRAKECLYLTYAQRRQLFSKTMNLAPSPFLSDIEENLKVIEVARKKPKKLESIDNGQMQLF
jgi:DNA helicase-2/ATP-dependent DNA helicase PcrA